MTLVVDASVVVKWVLPESSVETDTQAALGLLGHIRDGRVAVLQPPHWLAEVAAVTARLAPRLAREVVGLLYAMELPVSGGPEVYERASDLAGSTGEHVFDTLYHAVALGHPVAVLVTADERYYRRAASLGRMVRLRDFRPEAHAPR